MARNPFYDPSPSAVSPDQIRQLVTVVRLYLVANRNLATVPDATLRLLKPALADATVWRQVQDALGL